MRIPRRVTSRELGDHGLLRVHGHDLDTGLRAITLDVPDWVLAVATNAAGQLVCVRQFRFGTETVTLEVAGGVLEPGENPAEAARRELYEETGHEGGEAVPLGWVHPNPALQANRAHLFLFEGAKHVGPPQNHEGEETEVVLLSRDEAREATRDGRITHVACSLAVERALARTDALATVGALELVERMEAAQREKVLSLARRLLPHLTAEDIRNPQDFPQLDDPDWHFEDGQLTGIAGVLFALRQTLTRQGGR